MTIKSALNELNNAILDLQSADYNTYERPLRRLAAILISDDLVEISNSLKSKVDFDAFVQNSNRSDGMSGSSSLNWPVEKEGELGLTISLIERAAADPQWFLNFAHEYYYGGRKVIGCIRNLTTSVIIPFGRDFKSHVEESAINLPADVVSPSDFERVFIVHGHDEAPREAVARFLSKIGLEPIILHEQANEGMTIPEKLARHSNVGFAVVLVTPDDVGRAKNDELLMPRARQNVILELGYFIGLIGRERVCALLKDTVEFPTDYLNVGYHKFDSVGGWKQNLARELKSAGYNIDWNKVMN